MTTTIAMSILGEFCVSIGFAYHSHESFRGGPDQLAHKDSNVRIERIVSYSDASPEGFWYDQDHAEWVMVLEGAARLRFDDELVEMTADTMAGTK